MLWLAHATSRPKLNLLRAIFIFAGVALINRVEWILYIFGGLSSRWTRPMPFSESPGKFS